MGLFIALGIGIAVGAAAGLLLMDTLDYLLINLLMGIVGSLLGLGVYYLFLTQGSALGDGLFSFPAALCSIIGALIFVFAFVGVQKLMPKRVLPPTNTEDTPPDER